MFAAHLSGNQNDNTIAHTIISMGRALAMNMIAAGIETEAQRCSLEKHDCLAYQDYLFSRPLPIDELEKFLF